MGCHPIRVSMLQRVSFCVLEMYDTLEIPLLPGAPFTDRIRSIKIAVEHVRDPLISEVPFQSNLYYTQIVDLRKVADVDAVLHLNARKTGTHKIQLIEAGKKCYGEIAEIVSSVVEEHPELQTASRVDACADIADGPEVKWMVQSVRAKWAQWQAQFGTVQFEDVVGKKMQWSDMGRSEVKTMYMGKRPNCFRIYDKLNERFRAWMLEKRRHELEAARIVLAKSLEAAPLSNGVKAAIASDGRETRDFYAKKLICSGRYYAPFPAFEDWFRDQCSGAMQPLAQQMPKVLTRIERQMGAGRVPSQLGTLEKMFSRDALDFNPFDRLEFRNWEANTEIVLEDYTKTTRGLQRLAAGTQVLFWIREGEPWQRMYARLNKSCHGKKFLKDFAPFIAAADAHDAPKINRGDLFDRYRDSLSRQMAA